MDRFLVAWQLGLLFATTVGWGYWIWRLAGRPPPLRRQAWLWCGMAGFCAQALVLQSLVYLGLPLARSAWAALAITLGGIILGGRKLWRGRHALARRDGRLIGGVFAAVFLAQATSLLWLGPLRYYGKGHYDQAVYVMTAQFIVEKDFSMEPSQIGTQPWLVRALSRKEQRITQSIANGALAVTSGSDCQASYGTLSVFFIALAGVATTAWLRTGAAPRWLAALGGIGTALTPALTTIHLDGFFSQAATVFVFPALAGVLWPRGETRRETRIVAVVLLAFLLGAYTEFAALGWGMAGVLLLAAPEPGARRWRNLGIILTAPFLLNPGYGTRLVLFLHEQWNQAHAPLLSGLFPESGTWRGWGRLFFDVPGNQGGWLVTLAGVMGAGAILAGIGVQSARRRTILLLLLLVPLAALVFFWIGPETKKYAFAKLTLNFTPLWIGVGSLGLAAVYHRVRSWRKGIRIGAWALVGLSAATALPQHFQVIRGEGSLASLGAAEMLGVRAAAAAHPERAYLVACDDPLVAVWLCYYGRHSTVYFNRRNLGDVVVPTETYAFRRLPVSGEKLWWLDLRRIGPVDGYEPAVTLAVRSAAETDKPFLGQYTIEKEALEFTLIRQGSSPIPVEGWLDFVAIPLTGDAGELELTDAAGNRQRTTVTIPRWLRFHVTLAPGRSVYNLRLKSEGSALLRSFSVETAGSSLAIDPTPATYVAP